MLASKSLRQSAVASFKLRRPAKNITFYCTDWCMVSGSSLQRWWWGLDDEDTGLRSVE